VSENGLGIGLDFAFAQYGMKQVDLYVCSSVCFMSTNYLHLQEKAEKDVILKLLLSLHDHLAIIAGSYGPTAEH